MLGSLLILYLKGMRILMFRPPFPKYLPLVIREWKNGSNSSYNCTPFLRSLLAQGKNRAPLGDPLYGFIKTRGLSLGTGAILYQKAALLKVHCT